MSLVANFLTQIRTFVKAQNGAQLASWLKVENAHVQYHKMADELRQTYPVTAGGPAALEKAVDTLLPEDDDVPDGEATVWPGFVTFMKEYLLYWRDVHFGDLLGAHTLLSGLVTSCGTAFAHPTYGAMLLQTSMSLCEALSRLTMTLSRRPDLTLKSKSALAMADPEDGRKSIAETSAEIITKIFTTCLTDRSQGLAAANSRPQGKKAGVYMFANLVLRLLFACRRAYLARQLFTNIRTNAAPLALYPASQRVTFLYYLGRFYLANNHFLRAAACLEEAYLETPANFVTHRATILTYLLPCNLLLGRFPSAHLLARPECASLGPIFVPLAQAVKAGNFLLLQQTLAQHETWLFDKGVLLVLNHRLRPLVWRSLARRTFLLTYTPPADPASNLAATLSLVHLETTATYLQRRLEGWVPALPSGNRPRPQGVTSVFLKAVANNVSSDTESTLVPPPGGPRKLRPNEGLLWGNLPVTLADVEMMVAALIQQGLLRGYVAHGSARFAILGAKQKGGPAVAGWPTVWLAIRGRIYEEDVDLEDVPGWVR